MKTKSILLVVLLVFTVVSCFSVSHRQVRKVNLDASGIDELEIECGPGFLKVKGIDDLKDIEFKATIEVKGVDKEKVQSFIEDNVTISLKKDGNKAELVSKVASSALSSIFKNRQAWINLEVRVPKKMELDIDDGSGFITVSDISADVKIEDGSGAIVVKDIGGNVEIEDGSGAIQLDNVKGDVDVDDNSGLIKIVSVGGSVVVDDGSGGIHIDGVEKNVTIKNAGSGSVSIKNVKGKVRK
ncbi:MAG: hypothetical protein GY950_15050 [bacterium]|nr:hypothetical protein [bacterium]